MKNQLLHLLLTGVLILTSFISCSQSDDLQEPELTYHEKEIIFLKDFREKARGEWNIEKIVVAKNYIFNDNSNDSIVYNPGRIFVNNIYNDPINADKYNQLQAYFYMNDEVIPFKSVLYPFTDFTDTGVYGVVGMMMSDYYIPFPVSSDKFSDEYRFLDNYFFGENFSMTLSEDEKTWTWNALNRYVREMTLTRK